jgi:hypothetical protein
MARSKQNRRERRRRQRLARRRASSGGTSTTLQALWGSALALASLPQAARADAPIERLSAEYNFSRYTEDNIPSSKVFFGETSRYEIDMHQFSLRSPLTSVSDIALELVHETMSGASPWYNVPDIPGPGSEPLQFMTGATIDDARTDVLASYNRYYDNARVGYSAGYSTENDYRAINVGVEGETHFNEGNTTVSGGLGISIDSIEPTDADLFSTRPDSEDKKSLTLMGGYSQILNRAVLVDTSLTYKFSDGYLSDPYKAVWYQDGGIILSDERPDSHHQLAWLSRFRGHVRELEGTLQADYRLGLDDWGIISHTIELAWHQALGHRLSIRPSFRYYSQGEADFYRPYYDLGENPTSLRSSDFRLSAYGAILFGIKGQYRFRTRWTGKRDLVVTLAWDRYFSSEDLSFDGDASESPGLVDYDTLTLGLTLVW